METANITLRMHGVFFAKGEKAKQSHTVCPSTSRPRPDRSGRIYYYCMLLVWMLLGGMSVSSCNEGRIYFQEPQPADAKNIAHFPSKMRGVWRVDEATVKITKDRFQYIYTELDTLTLAEIDTSDAYLISGQTLYIFDELEDGYARIVARQDGYLVYEGKALVEFWINERNPLRRVGEQYLFSSSKNVYWWELYLLAVAENGDIVIKRLCANDLPLIDEKELIKKEKYTNSYYYAVKWTRKELEALLEKGFFSDTVFVLAKEQRHKSGIQQGTLPLTFSMPQLQKRQDTASCGTQAGIAKRN